jgi:hypothetical protein
MTAVKEAPNMLHRPIARQNHRTSGVKLTINPNWAFDRNTLAFEGGIESHAGCDRSTFTFFS